MSNIPVLACILATFALTVSGENNDEATTFQEKVSKATSEFENFLKAIQTGSHKIDEFRKAAEDLLPTIRTLWSVYSFAGKHLEDLDDEYNPLRSQFLKLNSIIGRTNLGVSDLSGSNDTMVQWYTNQRYPVTAIQDNLKSFCESSSMDDKKRYLKRFRVACNSTDPTSFFMGKDEGDDDGSNAGVAQALSGGDHNRLMAWVKVITADAVRALSMDEACSALTDPPNDEDKTNEAIKQSWTKLQKIYKDLQVESDRVDDNTDGQTVSTQVEPKPGNGEDSDPTRSGRVPPADGSQPPADGARQPADGARQPADGAQPPADAVQKPGENKGTADPNPEDPDTKRSLVPGSNDQAPTVDRDAETSRSDDDSDGDPPQVDIERRILADVQSMITQFGITSDTHKRIHKTLTSKYPDVEFGAELLPTKYEKKIFNEGRVIEVSEDGKTVVVFWVKKGEECDKQKQDDLKKYLDGVPCTEPTKATIYQLDTVTTIGDQLKERSVTAVYVTGGNAGSVFFPPASLAVRKLCNGKDDSKEWQYYRTIIVGLGNC